MVTNMRKRFRRYLQLGYDKKTLNQVRYAIDYDNMTTVKNVTILLIIILVILLIFYSVSDNSSTRNILCLISVVLMIGMNFISKYFLKHKHLCTPRNCDIVINILTGICFAVAIYLGTGAAPNDMAVAPVWMFFFIILIFNRLPIQNIVNLCVYGTIFMLCSVMLKSQHHIEYDMMHALTSAVASAYVSWSKTRLKIQSVIAVQHLKHDNLKIKKTVENQVKKVDELQKQVKIDILSGFYKKESFESEVSQVLEQSKQGDFHMLLCSDIDDFKAINDTFGHLYGDEVLKDIANEIRAVFGEDALYGRFGGDEFLVFVKDIQDVDLWLRKADELELRCCKTYQVGDVKLQIGLSGGFANYNIDGITYHDLFEVADMKLYKAKRKKKVGR